MHVLDASRVVNVESSAIYSTTERRKTFDVANREEQAKLRELHRGQGRSSRWFPYQAGVRSPHVARLASHSDAVPNFLGHGR